MQVSWRSVEIVKFELLSFSDMWLYCFGWYASFSKLVKVKMWHIHVSRVLALLYLCACTIENQMHVHTLYGLILMRSLHSFTASSPSPVAIQCIGDVYQVDLDNPDHVAAYGSDRSLEVSRINTHHMHALNIQLLTWIALMICDRCTHILPC